MTTLSEKLRARGITGIVGEPNDGALQELIARAEDAQAGHWSGLSTSEQLATAFILNRPEWIKQAGYTLADAVRRIGPDWMATIPDAAEALRDAG